MAALTLQSYTLQPLNPDGTVNSNLPTLSGTTPPSSGVDFAFMGQRFKLELEFELSGTYPDASTFNVNSLFVRYTPAMFLEKFSTFTPGIIPTNGYTFVIPSSIPATYPMALVMQRGESVLSNENGNCTLEVVDSTHFKIIHQFRVISDTEDYLTSVIYENQTRLSKNSVYASTEGANARTSVFNTEKAYNAVISTQKGSYKVFASEFSIPFAASFNGENQSGEATLPLTITLTRDSIERDSLSPYENTVVKLEWEDPDHLIQDDEAVVIITKRSNGGNVANFEKDLNLVEAKLVTTRGGVISGPIKGPVHYHHGGGKTSVTFHIDKSGVQQGFSYDIHGIGFYSDGPSSTNSIHGYQLFSSDAENLPVDFDMNCEWWSRNGKHANNFSTCVMDRLINVCEADYADYNSLASPPFTTFDQDFQSAKFELKNAVTGAVIHSGIVGKNSATNVIQSNAQITTIKDEANGKYRFVANAFRVPYENFQDLPNLGANPNPSLNSWVLTWTLEFVAATMDSAVMRYVFDCPLEVRPYENQNGTISYSPKVYDITFRDPSTGLPISAWCDLEEIIVTAKVDDLGGDDFATTYAIVFVDKNPYGVLYLNDFGLEEEDPQSHSLPSYIDFEELTSDKISQYDFDNNTGTVSFRLDISELSGDEKQRISILAYQSND